MAGKLSKGPRAMKLPRQFLSAARDRRAGAAARAAGAARAHDPFRAAAHRKGARQGAGAGAPGRRRARQSRGRDSGRRQGGGARAASSRWRRRTTSARPGCGRGSMRSTRPGCSTTSPRSSPRSATSSTSIMLPKVEGDWDIHYLDQLLAQLEARHGVSTADPDPRHPGNRAGRQQRRGDRRPPRRACTA